MKLADWLHTRSYTPEQLRRMLNVKDRSTIHRWLSGARRPGSAMIQKIADITQDEVTLQDFLDTSPPRCAQVTLEAAGNPRLLFPWSKGYDNDIVLGGVMSEPPEGSRLSNAVIDAMEKLAGRIRFTKKGVFLLDGRISDVRRIVAEANRILVAEGKPEIPYPTLVPRHDDPKA
tara:strand:- start:258 stop:779 length:522 start_codon:yes stop_codon:yes gene_type:complete